MNTYKTIGIIGGVGPIATADFYSKLLSHVPAQGDYDYPHIIIDSDSSIPDRTLALFGHGPDPVQPMVNVGKNLIDAGAELICIPCNTAHAFYESIQSEIQVPIVHMVSETAKHIKKSFPHTKQVGVLGTSGTLNSQIYDRTLADFGLEVEHVSGDTQRNCVMEAIYGTNGLKAGKKNKPKKLLTQAVNELAPKVDVIVAACTEIPLVISDTDFEVSIVDSSDILAQSVLEWAKIKGKALTNRL